MDKAISLDTLFDIAAGYWMCLPIKFLFFEDELDLAHTQKSPAAHVPRGLTCIPVLYRTAVLGARYVLGKRLRSGTYQNPALIVSVTV